MTEDVRVPVLIVGAGVAGLTASLFLAQQGVRTLLVERHEGTSIYPRSRGVNGRTMELMRELGVADEIRAAGERLASAVGIHRGASLAEVMARQGHEGWFMRKMRARGMRGTESKKSTTGPCRCTQDELEPILLRAARERGVEARFSTELTSFSQDETGVSAIVVDRKTNKEASVRADYLIAADGSRSPIRTRLGVAQSGSRTYGHQLNVLFRADLASLVRGREFSMCLVENARVRGLIAAIDNASKWVIHISYDPESGDRVEDFTAARCETLAREAIGIPDLPIEIFGVSPWQSSVRIAEHYRVGRIFLAGDSAHSMPPWGGFGANTAIQDSHNLAWKLALVLAGVADEKLLDTYETERLPVGRAVGEISGTMNGDRGLIAIPKHQGVFHLSALRLMWRMRRVFPYMTMGYGYVSQAITLEGKSRPGPGTSSLNGQPGTRVPHVWIARDGKRVSTLDLIEGHFVLFAGADADPWCDAFERAATRLQLRVGCVRIHELSALGIRENGALLVRPDGIVAWRAKRSGPSESLARALEQVLARRGYDADGGRRPSSRCLRA